MSGPNDEAAPQSNGPDGRTERIVTVRGAATTLAMSSLVLLIQASDCAPRTCPPTGEVVKPGPASRSTPSVSDTELGRRPGSDTPAPPRRTEAPAPPTGAPAPRTEMPRPQENAAPAASRPSPASTPEPPALDLSLLEKRLRDTNAIGVFTKLSLKNQVDDLLEQFREFHTSRDQSMLTKLRQNYDLLLLKVLSLLQDGDPALARDVSSSREALWSILVDPDKFKNL